MALRPAWNSTSSSQWYLSRASYTLFGPPAAPASIPAALIVADSCSSGGAQVTGENRMWGKGDIGGRSLALSSLTASPRRLTTSPTIAPSLLTQALFPFTTQPPPPPPTPLLRKHRTTSLTSPSSIELHFISYTCFDTQPAAMSEFIGSVAAGSIALELPLTCHA